MWVHLGHFFGSVMGVFFNAIGTTLLGILIDLAFTGSIAAVILYQKKQTGGWRLKFDHLRAEYSSNLAFAFCVAAAVYTPVVVWSVGEAVYEDHTGLSRARVRKRH